MKSLTPTERDIYKFIKRTKWTVRHITQSQVAEHFGYDKSSIDYFGKSLERKGYISRQKGKGSAFWEAVSSF